MSVEPNGKNESWGVRNGGLRGHTRDWESVWAPHGRRRVTSVAVWRPWNGTYGNSKSGNAIDSVGE